MGSWHDTSPAADCSLLVLMIPPLKIQQQRYSFCCQICKTNTSGKSGEFSLRAYYLTKMLRTFLFIVTVYHWTILFARMCSTPLLIRGNLASFKIGMKEPLTISDISL